MLCLYDTLTRKKEVIFAEDGRRLRFYCCGPTVYGPAHIGNFRTFLVQDLFRRVVELSGLPTCHIRNITDVDDKTIQRAQAEGQPLAAFTRFWVSRFHRDGEALNLLPPHEEPCAVAHMADQIRLIERLLDKGHAYQGADGSIYFNVGSFDAYGKLSLLDKREVQVGASGRAHCDTDTYGKEALADFVLWKARKAQDGPYHWSSPWGEGRPGWHLECSTMGMRYLGESFDLHSGGIDLEFPHHENEMAQSEAATGKRLARHWFHVAHLLVDGKKMSKRLGNLYTLSDIQARGYTAAELRYALLSAHYRQPLNFTLDALKAARSALQRLSKVIAALTEKGEMLLSYEQLLVAPPKDLHVFESAREALWDDLNVPLALGRFFSAIKTLEATLMKSSLSVGQAEPWLWALSFFIVAFGWRLPAASDTAVTAENIPAEIKVLAEKRWAAKQAKDWKTADVLRDQLKHEDWIVKDARNGYEIVKAGF